MVSWSKLFLTNFNLYFTACKQFLEDEDLPDAYDVPGSSVPGSQSKTHTVNSVKNSDHSGDGPGSLDYDMDASLMGYQPMEVRFTLKTNLKETFTKGNQSVKLFSLAMS